MSASSNPSKRSYRFSEVAATTATKLTGNYILKRVPKVSLWRPSWNATTTTVRLFPGWSPEDPQKWDVWRLSDGDNDWGDWIRIYPAVRNFGDPGVTFLLYDPTDVNYDPRTNPCVILRRAVTDALQAGTAKPHWIPLAMPRPGGGPTALSRITEVALVQGAILQHNNTVFDPPKGGASDDGTVVLELSVSAMRALFQLFNERDPEYRGSDLAKKFICGDPIALDRGKFVHFYQLGSDPRQASVPKRGFGTAMASPARRGKGNDDPIGFGCFLTDEFNGLTPDLSGIEPLIRTKVKRWEDILWIPSHEQQIRWLSGAFPPDMVEYALRDVYPDLLPDSVKRAARGVSASVLVSPSVPPPVPKPSLTEMEDYLDQPFGGASGWGAASREEPLSEPEEQEEFTEDRQEPPAPKVVETDEAKKQAALAAIRRAQAQVQRKN